MIAQQILMPEFRKGLDLITSIWTEIPYYKAEGKEFLAGFGAWEQGWNYNAMDSVACAEAYPRQTTQLIKQKNIATYNRQRLLIEPLAFMMERGIRIDVEGMKAEYDSAGERLLQLEDELNTLAGRPLNAKSPKQLAQYFYIEKGHYPYKGKRGSKGPSTDETTMKRLIRKGVKEAQYVLDIRRLTKLRSTYLDPSKVDADGRMRCAYNPVGTLFSRLSSSESIFGSGNNLQNQPHEVLKYFKPDKPNVIYSIDLAQAENRIVAYAGRVDTMIEAFEKHLDLHSLTGALISGKPYREVIEEDKDGTACHLGSGDKTWRFWGKKANHGLNYDLGYRKFALYYEISETDGRFIVEKYHSAYPGVRNGYHAHVKQQLANGRVITNLLGRRTLLLDEWGDNLFKKGYSCIPQGSVGDIINERGLEYIYYNQQRFSDVSLMLQVHDSIAFEIPLSIGWTEHARILLDIKQSLETPLTVHGMEFVIPADIAMGYSLYKNDMEEIKGLKCPSDIPSMAKLLEERDGVLNGKTTNGLVR
jgi:DNA polymerase-1